MPAVIHPLAESVKNIPREDYRVNKSKAETNILPLQFFSDISGIMPVPVRRLRRSFHGGDVADYPATTADH
jgi:hypothetical protein